jgi:hypothetical protein
MACADWVLSATLVAVIVTLIIEPTLGAVNNPLVEMVPFEACQVTAVLDVLFTVAENCCVAPPRRLADAGVIETDTAVAGLTETDAWALFEGSATLVAVTFTLVVEATLGAVNKPVGEIVPFELDQVTAGFEALLTVAENCCVPAEATVADVGFIETETEAGATGSTETDACALFEGSATLVAMTITLVVEVTVGAVNMPSGETFPLEADQVTAVFEVLLTLAENCCQPPEGTVELVGETLTLTLPELRPLLPTFNEMVASLRSPRGRSVTRTRKLKDPALWGVPITAPLFVNDNPWGKSPLTWENW